MRRSQSAAVIQALGGTRATRTEAPPPRMMEGIIWEVTAQGIRFKVRSSDKHVWGPAPWPRTLVEPAASGEDAEHDHEGSVPTKGDRCLVIFVDAPGRGVPASGNPWVVGWWPA